MRTDVELRPAEPVPVERPGQAVEVVVYVMIVGPHIDAGGVDRQTVGVVGDGGEVRRAGDTSGVRRQGRRTAVAETDRGAAPRKVVASRGGPVVVDDAVDQTERPFRSLQHATAVRGRIVGHGAVRGDGALAICLDAAALDSPVAAHHAVLQPRVGPGSQDHTATRRGFIIRYHAVAGRDKPDSTQPTALRNGRPHVGVARDRAVIERRLFGTNATAPLRGAVGQDGATAQVSPVHAHTATVAKVNVKVRVVMMRGVARNRAGTQSPRGHPHPAAVNGAVAGEETRRHLASVVNHFEPPAFLRLVAPDLGVPQGGIARQ